MCGVHVLELCTPGTRNVSKFCAIFVLLAVVEFCLCSINQQETFSLLQGHVDHIQHDSSSIIGECPSVLDILDWVRSGTAELPSKFQVL